MRITIDLDLVSELETLKTYLRMKRMGRVEAELSARRKGPHFIVYGLPITLQQSIELRRWLGDDGARVDFDEYLYEHKTKQILFTSKTRMLPIKGNVLCKKKKDEVLPLDEGNILALPFCSRVPARKRKGGKRR